MAISHWPSVVTEMAKEALLSVVNRNCRVRIFFLSQEGDSILGRYLEGYCLESIDNRLVVVYRKPTTYSGWLLPDNLPIYRIDGLWNRSVLYAQETSLAHTCPVGSKAYRKLGLSAQMGNIAPRKLCVSIPFEFEVYEKSGWTEQQLHKAAAASLVNVACSFLASLSPKIALPFVRHVQLADDEKKGLATRSIDLG